MTKKKSQTGRIYQQYKYYQRRLEPTIYKNLKEPMRKDEQPSGKMANPLNRRGKRNGE